MTAEGVHVPDINRKIAARLPLNVQGRIHGVGQLVGPVIDSQIEGLVSLLREDFHWAGKGRQ